MPRTSKTDQELAYLRSAWEEVEYIRVELDYHFEMALQPTVSRGVWAMVMVAESNHLYEDGVPHVRLRTMHRFPNGRNISFAGELWSVLHRFVKEIEEAEDAWKRAPK